MSPLLARARTETFVVHIREHRQNKSDKVLDVQTKTSMISPNLDKTAEPDSRLQTPHLTTCCSLSDPVSTAHPATG